MVEEAATSLTAAVAFVAEAKKCLTRQRARLVKLKALGEPTRDAEYTLEVYQSTLELLLEHERALRRRLH